MTVKKQIAYKIIKNHYLTKTAASVEENSVFLIATGYSKAYKAALLMKVVLNKFIFQPQIYKSPLII